MEKKGHLRQSTLKGKNFTFFNLLFWKDRKRKRKKFGKEREREREDLTYLYFWRESLKLTLSNRSNKLIEATKNCLSLSLSLSSSYLLSLSLSLSLSGFFISTPKFSYTRWVNSCSISYVFIDPLHVLLSFLLNKVQIFMGFSLFLLGFLWFYWIPMIVYLIFFWVPF